MVNLSRLAENRRYTERIEKQMGSTIMRRNTWIRVIPVSTLLALTSMEAADVLTYHNDNARTGQNLAEVILTTANVKPSTFGRLFTISVDGKVDAQPLYVSGVLMPGNKANNLLVVATENGTVYTFDADTGAISAVSRRWNDQHQPRMLISSGSLRKLETLSM